MLEKQLKALFSFNIPQYSAQNNTEINNRKLDLEDTGCPEEANYSDHTVGVGAL